MRPLRIAAALSLALHLLALFVADRLMTQQQDEIFRARFTMPTRFSPRRAQADRPTLPQTQMQYRATPIGTQIADPGLTQSALTRPLDIGDVPLQLQSEVGTPKAGGPLLATEQMPSATQGMPSDTLASQSLELLRIQDMIRADDKRAVVIPDPDSVRGTKGFIKFTPLDLDGAWSLIKPGDETQIAGRPVLGDLARYMRDYTGIHAQIRSTAVRNFLSNELLRDPIHFFFPGQQRVPFSEPRIRLAPKEIDLLADYLRGGGFLFADAGGEADDRRFLRGLVDLLRQALGSEGRLYELPSRHPAYHAFYDYDNGFPGECKDPVDELALSSPWFFPDRLPGEFCPRGLWGIAIEDRLVGVISDLNLNRSWPDTQDSVSEEASDVQDGVSVEPPLQGASLPSLRAATNIVVHALLRPEGVATKHDLPAWQQLPPEQPRSQQTLTEPRRAATQERAQLALIRSPVGSNLGDQPLRVRLSTGTQIEVAAADAKGLILRSLPSGEHELQVDYGGYSKRITVELVAGLVTIISFRRRGLGPLGRLTLGQMEQRLTTTNWEERFSDFYLYEAAGPHETAGVHEPSAVSEPSSVRDTPADTP
jgi:hypothetical protein